MCIQQQVKTYLFSVSTYLGTLLLVACGMCLNGATTLDRIPKKLSQKNRHLVVTRVQKVWRKRKSKKMDGWHHLQTLACRKIHPSPAARPQWRTWSTIINNLLLFLGTAGYDTTSTILPLSSSCVQTSPPLSYNTPWLSILTNSECTRCWVKSHSMPCSMHLQRHALPRRWILPICVCVPSSVLTRCVSWVVMPAILSFRFRLCSYLILLYPLYATLLNFDFNKSDSTQIL